VSRVEVGAEAATSISEERPRAGSATEESPQAGLEKTGLGKLGKKRWGAKASAVMPEPSPMAA
jgi:hypothetical protein